MKNTILLLLLALLFLSCGHKVEDQPNFLIIFTDDQRLETLGCYDDNCPIQTPNLDRLASEGIRFSEGFVSTPICMCSRACLLTGRYVTNSRLHQFVTPMEDEVFEHIYPRYLKEAGYPIGNHGKFGIGQRYETCVTPNSFFIQFLGNLIQSHQISSRYRVEKPS